jgi:uncharacterized integral membrane protein
MRTFINTLGVVFIIVILLSFSMKNTTPVDLNYYYNLKLTFPAWALVLLPFFLGVVAGNLLDVIQRLKLKNEIKKLKREFKSLESD